ncbi:conserved hypothetical protein [Cellulomonas flavigena DSM 20109]|uniref:Uncharacterized protein n=1 Tax=Cellulomonas flavigena (strain ATCC 482 / DSM 20109 / BCRC 11376 / JCM 18109 / NBRC 3775 / NCIMB 8073 / NRS 134) TaxID=446466 RepID=D5UKS2_CELFN|nr:PH domain-containing protein [Cellulomonas flavigena]ADG73890.1 conserved hypothetical protein [Cellulomonas flavigena DSM 20109]
MGATQEFTSGYGRGLTAAVAVVALVAVVAVGVEDGAGGALRALPLAALVVAVVGALFWAPGVEVSDGEVVVRNVLRTVRVPWPTFREVEYGWSLVVRTTGGDVTVFAAPRESGTARRVRRGGTPPPAALPAEGTVRSLRATAETVGAAIEARHDALVRAGHLDGAQRVAAAQGLAPARRVHVVTVGAVAVLTALSVAVLVTG